MIVYSEFSTLILIALIVGGLLALILGGDSLAKGAAGLALLFKINPVIVGLTIVSVATSMPELLTALFAASDGNHSLAIGNILGSNLGNIGLIMGVTALIYPIHIQRRLILKEMPILLAATLVFSAVAYNGSISRIDGFFLIMGLVGYLVYLIKSVSKEGREGQEEGPEEGIAAKTSFFACFVFIVLGSLLLAAGAELLVGSAVEVAHRFEVSQVLIGITVVAVGTSLPELGASIAAARRKQSSICAGNIIGSNLFNLLFVGGGVATLAPLEVAPSLFQIEFPAMLMVTALLWFIFTTDRKVTRVEGTVLLSVYVLVILLSGFSEYIRFS